jgi:hypothetical protein
MSLLPKPSVPKAMNFPGNHFATESGRAFK